jgi:hypothetical protein
MGRPQHTSVRYTALAFAALGALAGCVNPNAIGVQDYGILVGRVYNIKTLAPVGSGIVSVGSTCTANLAPDGSFRIGGTGSCVPVGNQTLVITADGYAQSSGTVVVVGKGENPALPAIGLTPLF